MPGLTSGHMYVRVSLGREGIGTECGVHVAQEGLQERRGQYVAG